MLSCQFNDLHALPLPLPVSEHDRTFPGRGVPGLEESQQRFRKAEEGHGTETHADQGDVQGARGGVFPLDRPAPSDSLTRKGVEAMCRPTMGKNETFSVDQAIVKGDVYNGPGQMHQHDHPLQPLADGEAGQHRADDHQPGAPRVRMLK